MTSERIEITLDGKKLMVEAGKTILEAAEAQGIRIPTLCHDRRLEPYASCWVCLVKVEKAKGFVPSCATRVTPGMIISTSDPDVMAARRMALELLLSNHYGDCKAPCTLTCPSNIDIQGYIGLAANGMYREAAELIRRDNPMPAVIGRICPRPCESECRRRLVDDPININGLKRFVADFEAAEGGMKLPPIPPRMGKKAAIVGAGPAGLSAAWYLSLAGVDVTVFEVMEKAGGMLRYGIPDYRLPPVVLDRAIQEMLGLGAKLNTGVALGKEISLDSLRKENDAVILAIGAWKGRALRVTGEDHREVLSGIDFLKDVNSGTPVKVGARTAIIGGGNTALDAARCSLRLGAREVTIWYRRTREEMPAANTEIEEAIEEGIRIEYLAAPVSIQSEGERLVSVTMLRMALGEPDASGRRRPVPIPGSEFPVPVDTVISAVGQYADTRLLEPTPGLVDSRENLRGDPATGCTGVPGVFAAGDLLTGADIAIRAIAGGKHAAGSALTYLRGGIPARPVEFLEKKADFRAPVPEDYKDTPKALRQVPAVRSAETRKADFVEIESAVSRAQVDAETSRCLECGCQDVHECALKKHAGDYGAVATRFLGEVTVHPIDASHPFISRDPSKCILCGRCVRICLEVQGIGVFGYIYRGFSSVIAPSFGVPFGEDSSCISCGQCVSTCPVGALTEKYPARMTAPLPENIEEGYCSLCSMACPVEYRSHGGLLTRVTERYEGPIGGTLCAKGKFGHAFRNEPAAESPRDADGAEITIALARENVERLLKAAKRPLMRISPYLCAEAIDEFMGAAERRGIPVQGIGLEEIDPGWAALQKLPDGPGFFKNRLCILVGDIASSNNVAFTEAYRMRRAGLIDLWIVGYDDEVARRVASRVFPDVSELDGVLAEGRAGADVLVNPEEMHRVFGSAAEKAALYGLVKSAASGKSRTTLLWSSRNAGYLQGKLAERTGKRSHAGGGSPDLILDIGEEDGASGNQAGAQRIVWTWKNSGKGLTMPLPIELWIRGKSYPSGRESVQIGSVDVEVLRAGAQPL